MKDNMYMYMQFPALPLLVPFWTEVYIFYGKGLGRASTVVLWGHIFVLQSLAVQGVALIVTGSLVLHQG